MILKRWIYNWKDIIWDFFSCLGLLWLLTEVVSFFFTALNDKLALPVFFYIFIAISFLFAIFKNYPKSSYCVKIRDRDSWIELKVGDAFNNKGALVVPFNDYFDSALNGNVRKAKSIQSKLIQEYFQGNENILTQKITPLILDEQAPFQIGKVIEIESDKSNSFIKKSKRFYLLVNSKKQSNNRVKSTIDDFMFSLNGLWDFLSFDSSRDETVSIPLINTQHGRNPDITREVVVKQIIDTFIETSKHKSICEKLIISIHPSDLKKGDLNLDQLFEYQLFQCKNYKEVKFNTKPEGREIESSNIAKINC